MYASAEADVRSIAQALNQDIATRHAYMHKLVAYMAKSPRVYSLAAVDRKTADEIMPELVKEIGFNLTFTDASGKLTAESGSKDPRIDRSRDIPVAEALTGRSWRGVVTRNQVVCVACSEPFYYSNTLGGTITAYDPVSNSLGIISSDQSQREVAFVDGDRILPNNIGLDSKTIIEKNHAWSLDLGGQNYTAIYSNWPVSSGVEKLGFVVLRPKDAVYSAYRQFTIAFLVALLFLVVIGIFGGTRLGTGIVSSLDSVVNASIILKNGGWPEPLKISRNDEIGQLADTFNQMTAALRESQERLVKMIDLDPLTELPSHRRIMEILGHELDTFAREQEPVTLMLLDADNFGEYNHRFGHFAGDAWLKKLGRSIQSLCSGCTAVGRLEGEKFAVVFPNGSVEDAEALYKALKPTLGPVTLSAGSASYSSPLGDVDGLLAAATLALLRAKQLGKNQFCDFGMVVESDGNEPLQVYAKLKDGTYDTVRVLAEAVDAKDTYTRGHSDRVAQLGADLARFNGENPELVEKIWKCGTLHDVGKIGVPDAILAKSGPLTEDEMRTMQTHTLIGETIVRKVPHLRELLCGVRSHHERFDGKGYPDGLAGDQIPLIARYLAIADTYDAITSDRPYRPGSSPETALKVIRQNAGTQFDPELANRFVAMMEIALADQFPLLC